MVAGLDVIGFGAMNLDEIAVVPRIVVDGETRIRALRRRPGGSAANTVYALAKLGKRTGFVGVVGDDDAGRMLVADLARAGVDTSQVAVKRGAVTGFVWAIADGFSRSLHVYPGANDLLGRNDVRLSYLNRARLVHLSSFVHPRQLAVQTSIVRRLPTSVKISFAPGTLYAERGSAALRPILERTAVLFLNGDEAGMLTGKRDPRLAARALLRLGCRMVVITLGQGTEIQRADSAPPRGLRPGPRRGAEAERGSREPREKSGKVRAACMVTNGRIEEVLPALSAAQTPMDSVGAGDAFAAGFLYGLLTDRPLDECARLGQLVAQTSLGAPGAREALPDLRQLRRAYHRHFGASVC